MCSSAVPLLVILARLFPFLMAIPPILSKGPAGLPDDPPRAAVYLPGAPPFLSPGEMSLPSFVRAFSLPHCSRQPSRSKMDPNRMPYHMSLNFDEDVGYGFNDVSLPEPCSAVSFCGSSYAPSSFGPHTPLSGPSTPSRSASLDYGSSFASSIDGLSFEPSPPSSATSTYFPTSLKASDVSDFTHPSFPMTPPRGQLRFPGHPMSGCGTQLAHSPMDFCLYMNGLGSQSLSSTPPGLVKLDEPPDAWSIFPEPDSPISWSKKRSAPRLLEPFEPIKVEDEDVMTPPSTPWVPPRRRSRMEDARQKTADLRKAQQRLQSHPRARERRAKQRLSPEVENDGMITLAKAGVHKCDWEGCDAKPFQRREHMKRHVTR